MAKLPWFPFDRDEGKPDLLRAAAALRRIADEGHLESLLCRWLADRLDPESDAPVTLVPIFKKKHRPARGGCDRRWYEIGCRFEELTNPLLPEAVHRKEAIHRIEIEFGIKKRAIEKCIAHYRGAMEADYAAMAKEHQRTELPSSVHSGMGDKADHM